MPALVMILGFSQKIAQGTTLALMIPTIGLLTAFTYYKQGYVNIYAALFIILGFLAGSLIGSKYIMVLSGVTVTRIFAVFLIIIALKMLIKPN